MEANFRFVDLFAGIGGFHHALAHPAFGGECVLAVEFDPACQTVYKSTFQATPLRGDVRELTTVDGTVDRPLGEIARIVPDHEVLCAGFPCQPFSKSGAQLGIRDRTRGTLFFDILQIIRAKRPPFLILENVRNLAGPRHRDTWRTIISSLRAEGYQVADDPVVFSPHLLTSELGGTPQVRDRVFILGKHVGGSEAGLRWLGFPLVEYAPVGGWDPKLWRIEDWLDDDTDIPNLELYRLRPEEVGWIEAWNAFSEMIPDDVLPGFPIWADEFKVEPSITHNTPKWKADFLRKNCEFYRRHRRLIDNWRAERFGPLKQTVGDFPPSRRRFEWQARSYQPTRTSRWLWDLVLHLRPSGIRVKPPTYLPALVAITQTSVIGSRRRRITPREAARLQGVTHPRFDGIDDKIAYRQLGNAVSVGAVQWVARALFSAAGLPWGESRYPAPAPQALSQIQDPLPGFAELRGRAS